MAYRPTLPYAREILVAEILAVVREIGLSDKGGNRAVGDLGMRVMRTHDAVYVANQDRFDLQRAKLAVTALCEVIAA